MLDYDALADYSALAEKLCNDPQFDTDGLIAVKTDPLEMIYYNRDGSRASMCGNGIRCFAKYCVDHNLVNEKVFPVETLAGTMIVHLESLEPFHCSVNMGRPAYDTEKLGLPKGQVLTNFSLEIAGAPVTMSSVFMGTIHTVVFVEDPIAELSLERGNLICHHPLFSQQTNVNFVHVLNDHELVVRTFERGVGWTLACGTGCCASYVVARDLGKIKTGATNLYLERGPLVVSGTQEITMAGPAEFEFEKEVETC